MGDPLWVPKMPPGEVPAGTRSIVYGNYPARSSTHLCSMIFTTRPPPRQCVAARSRRDVRDEFATMSVMTA